MPLLPIIRAKSYGALEDFYRPIELFELYQAGGVGMQRIELRVNQLTRLFKMTGRSSTVSVPVLQYSQHGMACGIAGTQLQQVI